MFSIVMDLIEQNQTLIRWCISILLFLIFWIFKSVLTNCSAALLCKALNRKRQVIERAAIEYVLIPLKTFLVCTGLFLALRNLNLVGLFLLKAYRISVILVIAWILIRFVDRASGAFFHIGDRLDDHLSINLNKTLLSFLQKVLKFLIMAIAGVAILGETGTDVTTVITGIGLGGLTFALAAQDTAANLFGGLVILLDKPFDVEDWISTPTLEGVVEDITFRSTRIRTFADSLVVVPNSVLTGQPITNWSRMKKRRVSFSVGVTYNTPKEKIESCIAKITAMLERNEEVDPENIVVNFNGFQDSSLEIAIYFFTKTTSFAVYQKVKERVNFSILSIMEEEGVEFAFPTQTLYLESVNQR